MRLALGPIVAKYAISRDGTWRRLWIQLIVSRKRPKLAVLTVDYVNGPSSELEAAFQGRSWSMRLTGWSAMRVSTSRK